ncbi:MAG: 3D domain-containing protein [Carboxydocellales bacterium]
MQILALTLILALIPSTKYAPMKQYIAPPKPAVKHIQKQGVSRGGQDHGKYLGVFEATAYNLTKNRTSSGDKTRVGIVSVDPSVIPLGTKLYVEGYGLALASDTGSDIIGNTLDVWLPGNKAWDWGRRHVKVWEIE